jgi:hypothetical protein
MRRSDVLVFLYVLAAMGVAYWAKLDGRNPMVWFGASLILSPLGGSIALMVLGRLGR